LCIPRLVCVFESLCELVELDLVCVELRRVDSRVPEQRAKRTDVAAALAQEAVGKARLRDQVILDTR
jgi:hypothetical protein